MKRSMHPPNEVKRKEVIKNKVTAGRDAMSKFAPKFAELNDDVLFGEVWSRETSSRLATAA